MIVLSDDSKLMNFECERPVILNLAQRGFRIMAEFEQHCILQIHCSQCGTVVLLNLKKIRWEKNVSAICNHKHGDGCFAPGLDR